MWHTQRTRKEKENYFIFLANCYKRTFEDNIVFEKKYDSLLEYGKYANAYRYIEKISTYKFLRPHEIINVYLNNYPKAKIMGNEVFIVISELEKKLRLVYYSHRKKEWQEISYDELLDYSITYKDFKTLYEHFKKFIDDYNNDVLMSYLKEKYLTYPIKID